MILIRSHAVAITTEIIKRDRLIQRTYAEGIASRRELARAAGLSIYAITEIIKPGP